MEFFPRQVFFEPGADSYPLGQKLLKLFEGLNVPVNKISCYNKLDFTDKSPGEFYSYAKGSLVVGIKKSMKLECCKPSADYQFSLVTGCPGSCEYCYLQTNQSLKPFTRVYVNIEEILDNVNEYINKAAPNVTTFEAGSTCDPIAVEHLTGSVKRTIEFFSTKQYGKLRLVTKFSNIDSLLDINHNMNTKIRFSINSKYVIDNFEHNTDSLEDRLKASGKIYNAGYPLGFIIAPIMHYADWKNEYKELILNLKEKIENPYNAKLTFELIQYRFTMRAKNVIEERFPHTKLDMNIDKRLRKWGPFGNYKYVYPKEKSNEIKDYISGLINESFPQSVIEYFT